MGIEEPLFYEYIDRLFQNLITVLTRICEGEGLSPGDLQTHLDLHVLSKFTNSRVEL